MGERYVYVNGVFVYRIDATIQDIEEMIGGRVENVEPYPNPFCGPHENIHVKKEEKKWVD